MNCSLAEAMSHVTPTMVADGPFVIGKGALSAACTHEAGHAVANFARNIRLARVEVEMTFRRWDAGIAVALCSGVCDIDDPRVGKSVDLEDVPMLPFIGDPDATACWREYRDRALVTLGGPAAEERYRALTGIGRGNGNCSDARALEFYQRIMWLRTGRDGHAFARLVWRDTCRFVEDATVWRAIEKIDGALFRGLIWQEPVDPRPGDSIKFGLDGATVEALIAEAGVIRAEFHHECSDACVTSRRTPRRPSRRWQAYLDNSKKEQEAESLPGSNSARR